MSDGCREEERGENEGEEMTNPPRNCRWCVNVNEYEEGWFYCNPFDKHMTKAQVNARRKCPKYQACAFAADDYEGMWGVDVQRQKRELELYEKRMRGDWS